MKSSQPTRIRELFLEALELPAPERIRFLEEQCDAESRSRIVELLSEHDSAGDFMQGAAVRPLEFSDSEKIGDRIGRYKLLEQIGEGGAGVVYMAEQTEPVRRRVALKVIKVGMDTRSVVARFEAERQALAMMDHPNIARILDGGATEKGRPFFVMELVRGVRITDYCDQHNLSPAARLKLFVQVCRAIQHAHQKGIIHRDIKPSNILVTHGDNGPAPKVIDFGIAKATEQPLTEKTLFTELRSFIGTPAYMSPEQIEMAGADVDTRSDVYSLGVVLYELLTGHTPIAGKSLSQSGIDEFRRAVREDEPPAPSTRLSVMPSSDLATTASQRTLESRDLVKAVRGELDWIVMKCLEKNRARRYSSANDLADDVERFLQGDPIEARPPSSTYRLRKFLFRHRLAVGAATVVIIALVVASVVSLGEAAAARRAEHMATLEKEKAETESKRAQRNEARALLNEYVADITLAHQALVAGNFGRANHLLTKHLPAPNRADLRGFEWGYLSRLSEGSPHRKLIESGDSVRAVAFSKDGERIAVAGRDVTVLYDARTFAKVAESEGPVQSLIFAPDNSQLYIADQFSVRSFNFREHKTTVLAQNYGAPIALSADGKYLAAGARDSVRVFETNPWRGRQLVFRNSRPLEFSPDGKFLLTGGRFELRLSPLEGDGEGIAFPSSGNFGGFHQISRLATFQSDGKRVFIARDRILVAYDTATGSEIGTFPKDGKPIHTSSITGVAMAPNGRLIATASWDHSIQLWDPETFEHRGPLQGHLNEVWSLAFSPDSSTLISGAKGGGVYLWPLQPAENDDFIAGDWQPLAFSPDEKTLAVANRSGGIGLLDIASGALEKISENVRNRFEFGPGGGSRISASADLQIFAQQSDRSIEIWNRGAHQKFALRVDDPIGPVALSPSGDALIVGGWRSPSVYWNLQSMTNVALPEDSERALFTADGKKLILFQRAPVLQIWNPLKNLVEKEIALDGGAGFGAAVSPDSKTLAVTAAPDVSNNILLVDLASGASVGTLAGHKQGVSSVAFSADGSTVASGSVDGLKLWNVAAAQETLSLPFERPGNIVFSRRQYLVFNTRKDGRDGIQILKANFAAVIQPNTR